MWHIPLSPPLFVPLSLLLQQVLLCKKQNNRSTNLYTTSLMVYSHGALSIIFFQYTTQSSLINHLLFKVDCSKYLSKPRLWNTHTHTHTHTHTRCMYICTHLYMCVCTNTCMCNVSRHASMCVHVFCMYVCILYVCDGWGSSYKLRMIGFQVS